MFLLPVRFGPGHELQALQFVEAFVYNMILGIARPACRGGPP